MKFVVIESYPRIDVNNGENTNDIVVTVLDSFGDIAGYFGEGEFVETDFDNEIRFRRTDGVQIVVKAVDETAPSRIQTPFMP